MCRGTRRSTSSCGRTSSATCVDGTIVRVAPLAVLADEETQRRKLSDEQALSGELRVLTRPLSYAQGRRTAALLMATVLSQRGIDPDRCPHQHVDHHTTSPIALQRASDLIAHARFAAAAGRNRSAHRPDHAAVRPQPRRSVGRDGPREQHARQHDGSRVSRTRAASPVARALFRALPVKAASILPRPLSAWPCPARRVPSVSRSAPSTALSISTWRSRRSRGRDNGRLLSTPRVTTQNNIEAEMTQGVQIPIQTIANNTVTVTFKDAALTLKVTPQITASNTVIMRISVENASPDFSQAIGDIPPIDTQRAITQVLVSNGDTTVIGGIYVSSEQTEQDRTPGLNRIPLLGWLFKRDSIRDDSRELLIFITPRILTL